MIVGIGCDLLEIERVRELHTRFGEKLLRRVLHPDEMDAVCLRNDIMPRLAKHIAAKEAAYKSLGLGRGHGVSWIDFIIIYRPSGAPNLLLSPRLQKIIGLQTNMHISLSDTDTHALAYVVAEAASVSSPLVQV